MSKGNTTENDVLSMILEGVNQIPSMPRVFDGACLGWLLYAGSAIPNNSAFYGHIDLGWS